MKNSTIKKVSSTLLGILILLFLWQIIAICKDESLIFPPLSDIFKACYKIIVELKFLTIGMTLLRVLISVIFSFFISFILTLIYIRNKYIYNIFNPIISWMRATPIIAISIFIWILVGSTFRPYLLTMLVTIPIATQALRNGIDNIYVSNDLLMDDLALVSNSFFKALWYVYLPLLVPTIVSTILQIFGLSFKVMIMAEYIYQTNNSVGKILYNAQSSLEINNVLAWMILILIVVGVMEFLIKIINKKISYFQYN